MKTHYIAPYRYILFLLILTTTSVFSQGIMTPGGTGAWGNMIFVGVGITTPQPYPNKPLTDVKNFDEFSGISDMVASFGFGIGNPTKNLGLQFGINMLDVSEQDLYNFGAKAHRYFRNGISVGIGAENIYMVGAKTSDRAIPSAYIAMTHNFGYVYSPKLFISRFSYSIGAGYGRFSKLTVFDEKHHDRNYGTIGFAALQFRISKNFRYHIEWSGINLNTGLSFNAKLFKIPFSVVLAAADLTSFSGDRVRFLGAVGAIWQFKRKQKSISKDKSIEELIHSNERFALEENKIQHQHNMLVSKKLELSDKVSMLEEELDQLKKGQRPVNYGDKNLPDSVYGEPEVDNALNLDDDKIVKINKKEDAGYSIEPGIYLVIHSLERKENAIHAVKMYEKIGVQTKIGYNADREIHYLYVDKFPVSDYVTASRKKVDYRKNGFDDAWLFIKEIDDEENYYSKPAYDSILVMNEDISQIDLATGNKTPLGLGSYVILHAYRDWSKAEQKHRELQQNGIETRMLYNADRKKYYLNADVYDNLDAALEKRAGYLNDFDYVWVLIKNKPIEAIPTPESDEIVDLSENTIMQLDLKTFRTYEIIAPGVYLVIGTFSILDNARAFMETVDNPNASIAYNEDTKLYYVYVFKDDEKEPVVAKREEIQSTFSDAWVFIYKK